MILFEEWMSQLRLLVSHLSPSVCSFSFSRACVTLPHSLSLQGKQMAFFAPCLVRTVVGLVDGSHTDKMYFTCGLHRQCMPVALLFQVHHIEHI